ncbi:MAG: hypothetical protein IPK68_14095 [Bdellovibrionales bacterium]|nr:hypothetical protein [Bdellovibrionales bacterium]
MLTICQIILTLFSSISFAADFNLDEVPPLEPLRLLVSKLNANYYLLLARQIGGSNHYLVINNDGQIRVAGLEQHSKVYYDGGSADLYLESGERVVIPTKQQPENFLNTSLGPIIIYRDQAPTPLQDIKIDKAVLQRLGFSRFTWIGAKSDPKRSDERRQHLDSYHPLLNLESMVIVRVQLNERLGYDAQKAVESKLKNLNLSEVRLLEPTNQTLYGNSTLTLLASPSAIELIESQIPADTLVSLDVFEPRTSPVQSGQVMFQQELNENINIVGNRALALQARAESLILIHQNVQLLSSLSEAEKIPLIKGILDTLGDLDQAHALVRNFARYETAVSDFRSGRRTMNFPSPHLITFVELSPILFAL